MLAHSIINSLHHFPRSEPQRRAAVPTIFNYFDMKQNLHPIFKSQSYGRLAALICYLCFSATILTGQNPYIQITQHISGELFLVPNPKVLVLLHPGSGPTDRNGNQKMMSNNSLLFLAQELQRAGIAVFSIDKRVINQLKKGTITSKPDFDFDDQVEDLKSVIRFFLDSSRYEKLVTIGHSEGSLIGMLAMKAGADAFISLCGIADPAGQVIVQQIARQTPFLEELSQKYVDTLMMEKHIQNVDPILRSLFREDMQDFLITWFRHDPCKILAEIKKPVLIIDGDTDIQVDTEQGQKLQSCQPLANYKTMEGMNHVLKKISPADRKANMESYKNPELTIHPDLTPTIMDFLNTKIW